MSKGFDDIVLSLEGLKKDMEDQFGKQIQGMLKKAAEPLVNQIQSGIGSRWKLDPKIYGIIAKNQGKFRSARGASILLGWNRTNVNAYKGVFFEYGTLGKRTEPLHPRTKRKPISLKIVAAGGGLQAIPVVRPTFDSQKSKISDSIKKGLTQLVMKQAKKNNLETK